MHVCVSEGSVLSELLIWYMNSVCVCPSLSAAAVFPSLPVAQQIPFLTMAPIV